MGTTAEKLTYLNTTKGKIKDSINLTGAGITNQDTFRSYASKLKLGLIDIINNGTDNLYSNFPKVSGIGSNLSLTPTYEAPMRNLPLGDTLQNGTPTPSSPVPIQTATGLQNVNVCGKNLLPYPYFSGTTTNRGITFTPREDGSILVNGTATGQATFALYGNYLEENQKDLTGNYLSGGTNNVKLRAYNHTGSSYTDLGTDAGNGVQINKTTYTTGYIELVVANGTTINNVIIKPMMLNSLDDTSYEPYNDNTYEVNLGKNYIDNLVLNSTNNGITPNYNSSTNVIGFTGKATSSYATIGNITDLNITSGEYNLKINETKPYRIILRLYTDSTNYSEVSLNANTLSTIVNATNTIVNIRILINTTNGTTYNETFKLRFNSTNDIELNKKGDYQDSIKKSTGKNLFDKDEETTKYFIDANGVRRETGTTGDYFIEQLFTSNIASNYVISFANKLGTSYVRFSFFNGDTFISRTLLSTSGESVSVPSGTTKMYIHTDKSETKYFENLQIEVGTTPTSYEPYGKVWYVEKQIDKAVYTSGDIANAPRTYSNVKFFTIAKPTNSYMYNNYNRGNLLYTHAVEQITGDLDSADRINKISNVWPDTLWIGFDTSTTLETAQQVLNNSVLYYPLASTQYITITNTELIEDLETLYTAKSQEGTTNISITSEDLPMLLSASALKGDA